MKIVFIVCAVMTFSACAHKELTAPCNQLHVSSQGDCIPIPINERIEA